MKIAQVAPLIESVPPRLYGGTERFVSYLTEELVRLGHEVTLFASGDSITGAELAPCCTRGLRLDPTVRDIIPHFMMMIDKVRERAEQFDHFHFDLFHFPLFRSLAARTLTTLHGRQDSARQKLPAPLEFEESGFSARFRRATFRMPAALPSFLVQIFRHPHSFCLQAGAQSVSQPPAPWRGLADVAAQSLPAFLATGSASVSFRVAGAASCLCRTASCQTKSSPAIPLINN
jgi:glycosyltransferase involved in cell wall biosynthesis